MNTLAADDIPWLMKNFSLPDDLLINRKNKTFCRVAQWATERAKIELSSTDNCTIALSEGEARTVDAITAACRDMLEKLDTAELDAEAVRLGNKASSVAERLRKLIENNARVCRDREEYQRGYSALAAEHEKLSQQMQAVEAQKKDKADRRRQIEVFLSMLEGQEECMRFEPYTFVALFDKVIVGRDRKLEFIFRNGMKCEYAIVG